MPDEKAKLAAVTRTLQEQGLIATVRHAIKSGKEATVYWCTGSTSGGARDLALKVYRDLDRRLFRNDAIYWEGSIVLRQAEKGRESREARAMRKHSPFGRRFAAKTWVEHEWSVLERLWSNGLPVPEPIRLLDEAILMALFTTPTGRLARPVQSVELSSDDASWLFQSLCRDVEDMLRLDLVHGDLSPYNVLWNGSEYRIIDYPQSVDARFNPHAWDLLVRDLTTIARYATRFGVDADGVTVARQLWAAYQMS